MFKHIEDRLERIERMLALIIHKEDHMGKELDDLTAAVDTLQANGNALADALGTAMSTLDSLAAQLAAGVANQDGAAIESLAQQVTAVNTAQQAAVAALLVKIAADTPAPVPTATPAPVDTPPADSTPAV